MAEKMFTGALVPEIVAEYPEIFEGRDESEWIEIAQIVFSLAITNHDRESIVRTLRKRDQNEEKSFLGEGIYPMTGLRSNDSEFVKRWGDLLGITFFEDQEQEEADDINS